MYIIPSRRTVGGGYIDLPLHLRRQLFIASGNLAPRIPGLLVQHVRNTELSCKPACPEEPLCRPYRSRVCVGQRTINAVGISPSKRDPLLRSTPAILSVTVKTSSACGDCAFPSNRNMIGWKHYRYRIVGISDAFSGPSSAVCGFAVTQQHMSGLGHLCADLSHPPV